MNTSEGMNGKIAVSVNRSMRVSMIISLSVEGK